MPMARANTHLKAIDLVLVFGYVTFRLAKGVLRYQFVLFSVKLYLSSLELEILQEISIRLRM